MNCTNQTAILTLSNCTNQSIANQTLKLPTSMNATVPHFPPPYTKEEMIARATAYVVIAVLSILGNIIVMLAFYIERSLFTTFNLFLLNLAVIDVFTGIFRMGFNLIGMTRVVGWTWPFGQALCDFGGWIQGVAFTANIFCLLIMAIFRYLVVVHSKGHLVTRFTVTLSICVTWIFSIIEGLMPIFGWNRYKFQPLEQTCLPDWNYDKSFPIFVMVAIFTVPLLIMIYCYVLIYWTVKKNSQRIRGISFSGANNNALQKIAAREAKVTRAMFIVFATFVICFGPYSICMFLLLSAFEIWVGGAMAFFCGWMVNLNSVINPIVYPFINDRFKRAYIRIFSLRWKRDDAIPLTSNSNNNVTNIIRATTTRRTKFPSKGPSLIPRNGISTKSFRCKSDESTVATEFIYNDVSD